MNALTVPWLRRVARSAHASRLVLRGSVVTAQWCPGRIADDVDLLVQGACTVEEAGAMLDAILAEPDDVPLALVSRETIWADTPLPGVRTRVAGQGTELQIDVGWGDPLSVPARPISVEGVQVDAVAPETMFAWKAHGLVEHGGKWRAKDLFDLVLLLEHVSLDRRLLPEAVRVAFESRGHELAIADRLLFSGEWGRSRGSRRRWETFRRRYRGSAAVPAELADVASRVRDALRPIFAELSVTRA